MSKTKIFLLVSLLGFLSCKTRKLSVSGTPDADQNLNTSQELQPITEPLLPEPSPVFGEDLTVFTIEVDEIHVANLKTITVSTTVDQNADYVKARICSFNDPSNCTETKTSATGVFDFFKIPEKVFVVHASACVEEKNSILGDTCGDELTYESVSSVWPLNTDETEDILADIDSEKEVIEDNCEQIDGAIGDYQQTNPEINSDLDVLAENHTNFVGPKDCTEIATSDEFEEIEELVENSKGNEFLITTGVLTGLSLATLAAGGVGYYKFDQARTQIDKLSSSIESDQEALKNAENLNEEKQKIIERKTKEAKNIDLRIKALSNNLQNSENILRTLEEKAEVENSEKEKFESEIRKQEEDIENLKKNISEYDQRMRQIHYERSMLSIELSKTQLLQKSSIEYELYKTDIEYRDYMKRFEVWNQKAIKLQKNKAHKAKLEKIWLDDDLLFEAITWSNVSDKTKNPGYKNLADITTPNADPDEKKMLAHFKKLSPQKKAEVLDLSLTWAKTTQNGWIWQSTELPKQEPFTKLDAALDNQALNNKKLRGRLYWQKTITENLAQEVDINAEKEELLKLERQLSDKIETAKDRSKGLQVDEFNKYLFSASNDLIRTRVLLRQTNATPSELDEASKLFENAREETRKLKEDLLTNLKEQKILGTRVRELQSKIEEANFRINSTSEVQKETELRLAESEEELIQKRSELSDLEKKMTQSQSSVNEMQRSLEKTSQEITAQKAASSNIEKEVLEAKNVRYGIVEFNKRIRLNTELKTKNSATKNISFKAGIAGGIGAALLGAAAIGTGVASTQLGLAEGPQSKMSQRIGVSIKRIIQSRRSIEASWNRLAEMNNF